MIRIEVAAINHNGEIFSLPRPNRHHNIIRHMRTLGKSIDDIANSRQGFLTNESVFVGRVEALKIAQDAGQLLSNPGAPPNLFSEDVW